MYKSFLLLCLVVVVCARKKREIDSHYNGNLEVQWKPSISKPMSTQANQQYVIDTPVSQPQESKYQPCTTTDKDEGRCVPYYLCTNNKSINSSGAFIIDIRMPISGPTICPSYLETCCKIPDTSEEKRHPPSETYQQLHKDSCGWRNPDGVDFKIIGDIHGESKFGEFPWMVGILMDYVESRNILVNDLKPQYIGGGSLIHQSVVLTTAHYVVTNRSIKVRAGEWDTQTDNERYPYQERDVTLKIIHEDFKSDMLFYDIALLFLSSPMNTSIPNVGLACLPPPHHRPEGSKPCIASGWGKDKFGKAGIYQVILKKVTVPVVERKQCQTQLRKTRLGPFFELHSSFMCAGGEAGIDTCTGDGGSPLMCPIENQPDRYMISGMVAWGIGCGDEGTPGVYVDVSYLRDWIDDKVKGQSLDTKVYSF